MQPQFIACLVSVVILLISIGILKLQSLHGPQVIVPPRLQRETYNYFVKKPIRDPNVKDEDMDNCAICMGE